MRHELTIEKALVRRKTESYAKNISLPAREYNTLIEIKNVFQLEDAITYSIGRKNIVWIWNAYVWSSNF